ncbi:apicoplast RNA methyltransferase precursor, putative [Plasmodium malariae]|uniref:rRNA methyltransferase 1, mitochondrial n=1 Tax=Plasmodium malariae TaxID=5858 RepID=A0A1D3JJ90_PLAMA|nr:apicoplast RNA methyltransferase precursor, putative [Plasmodium malariae]SBT86446.1 apicoplast RNA methyltransferase precursor, putative [Plasmodium malariae]
MRKRTANYFILFFLGAKRLINNNVHLSITRITRRRTHGKTKTYKLYTFNKDKINIASLNIKRNKFLCDQGQNDVDYIYGLNSVCSVLKKNERTINSVMINSNIKLKKKTHKQTYEYIFETIKKRGIEVKVMSKHKMDELVGGFPHNNIIMRGNYRYMNNYKHFIKDISNKTKNNKIFVCLHDVYDNMNIGNICRSIFFFGGNTIFLKKKKKEGEKKNKIKIDTPILHSSVGASEFLDFFHVNHMANFMSEMKQNGFKIYSTGCLKGNRTSNNLIELKNVEISKSDRVLIILGNESKGLSENIMNQSDANIYINSVSNNEIINKDLPIESVNVTVDSLNVNNVCSILLYHFLSYLL